MQQNKQQEENIVQRFYKLVPLALHMGIVLSIKKFKNVPGFSNSICRG